MHWQKTKEDIYLLLNKIRVKHWIKNFIILIPAIDYSIRTQAETLAFLFLSLSLAASANYVLNDYLDQNLVQLSHTKIKRQAQGFYENQNKKLTCFCFLIWFYCQR